MHFSFPFSTSQVLFTLTFAAELVLLIVLLGRDRARRYPWFTASILLYSLRLLVEVILSGRLAMVTLGVIVITLASLSAVAALLVVAELAWQAFAGAHRRTWLLVSLGCAALAGAALAAWGPWPPRSQLTWASKIEVLRLAQFLAQKVERFADILVVLLGFLIVAFGRRFKAGWHSHTQRIVIGLSTVSIMWMAVQGFWQFISTTVHPQSQQEYDRIITLAGRLVNANKAVYIVMLVWWIACLWIDEPGAIAAAEPAPVEEVSPALAPPPPEE